MKLFGLGKKENETIGNFADSNSRILVLGACCKRSQESFENVKKAVVELGLNIEVANIKDNVIIAGYGIMQTPALVIDGKVITYGKLISKEDAKEYIKKEVVEDEKN